MTVNHNGASPQFTLTCISTGGPATTVTWTRDSTTVTEGTETVLDDPVTAQYTHTLTRRVARGVSWLPENPPFASWSWERSRWASGARSRQRTTCVITNRRSDSVEKNSYERNNKPDRRTM